MSDADYPPDPEPPRPESTRLREAMTRAVWPLAIAVPLVPILVAVIARPPGSSSAGDSYLSTLLVLQGVMLAAAVIGARLLDAQWRHTGERLVTRHQSWAILVIACAGFAYAFGTAVVLGPWAMIGGQAIVHGAFAVFVAQTAIIVLALRSLRGPSPERS